MGQPPKRSRDDFNLAVKELLAKRVAQRCSNQRCRQVTSGPHEDPNKAINIGVASHITAASPGGPRYDPSLSPQARSAVDNGIWLCQICSKLVDDDPLHYTAWLLRDWRRVAEAKAVRALENRWTLDTSRDSGSSSLKRLSVVESEVAQFLAAHRRYCNRLPYLSLRSRSNSKTLDDVYIPARLRRKASTSSDDENTHELSISDILIRLDSRAILISGWPGSGKSTLLRYVASRVWHHPDELGLTAPYLPLLVPAYRLANLEGSLETRLRTVVSDEYALDHDLPEGFMTEWSEHVEAKWLILIDGLDGLPQEKRIQFLVWLESILISSSSFTVLLSCRSHSMERIRHIVPSSSFEECELLVLSSTEATTLAANWIQENIDKFERQFDRISDSDIRRTPLLTTLAALVFRERGALPSRRAPLYEMFIDISLEEARLHALQSQLDPNLYHSTKSSLAFIASTITMNRSSSALPERLASWLTDKLGVPNGAANGAATEFLDVMAERSGVLARIGSSYDFLHPTFRQYLSAFHIAHQAGNDIKILRLGLFWLWEHPAWQESIVFLAGILSERPEQSDAAMRYLYNQCRWQHRLGVHSFKATYNLYLLAECLVDGAVVSEGTRQLIIRAMLKAAKSTRADFSLRVLIARDLASLKLRKEAQEVLPSLMQDSRVTDEAKLVIVESFYEIKCVSELLEVACDSTLDNSIRQFGVSLLGLLQAVSALVEILMRLGPGDDVHDRAVHELFRLAPHDELKRIAMTASSGEVAQVDAVLLLGSLGNMESLFSIACDDRNAINVRSVSLLSMLAEMTDENVLEEWSHPETRAKLQAPTLALLERSKGLWPEDMPFDEEALAPLSRLFTFVFGEADLLRDDNSNVRSLINKSISHISNLIDTPIR